MLNYELHNKAITLCLDLRDLFYSQLSIRLLRFIHDFAYTWSIIFSIIYHTPLYDYSTIYFDSLVQGHLKCCQFVATTNHAANILLLVPWEASHWSFSGIHT